MRTLLIINPFPSTAAHGIHNYNLNLVRYCESLGIQTEMYSNDKKLPPSKFREEVKLHVERTYGSDEVLIEAPEVKAATLYLDNKYDVHIRLHTPGAIAQKYDGVAIDENLFSEEISVIHKAKYVSSPSFGLLKELEPYLNRCDISVYKNPAKYEEVKPDRREKQYDVIFMARFQKLKGIEYLNDILKSLPENYRVLLLGPGAPSFVLSKDIICNVLAIDEIKGSERFEYLRSSKVLMQLSKFENCSMVILESLHNQVRVCAWDVGGNSEIASDDLLKTIRPHDVNSMVDAVVNFVDRPAPKAKAFSKTLEDINTDFEAGFHHVFHRKDGKFSGLDHKNCAINEILPFHDASSSISHDAELRKFGNRILGVSVSNEQIEQMWMPIVNKMGSDYLFISRRPLGFRYIFKYSHKVDKNKYKYFDWIRYTNLLISEIEHFKPNKMLFHNGSHPMYQDALVRIKKLFPNLPIIYSELGWFPQENNIYFDEIGTNGKSKMAGLGFEEFCGENFPINSTQKKLKEGSVLVVTQLENDTNIIVNSARFKKMEAFVDYVISELPDEKIIIKTHPLDQQKKRFEKYSSDKITVTHDTPIKSLMENSKAVVGINSTVLLEALEFDINIYMFGDHLLNNKKVAIDLRKSGTSLKESWIDYLYSNPEAKKLVLDAFKIRQINLLELTEKPICEVLVEKSFAPLLVSPKTYSNKIEFDKLEQRLGYANSPASCNNPETITNLNLPLLNKRRRKLRKLVNNPYLFFKDSKFFRFFFYPSKV